MHFTVQEELACFISGHTKSRKSRVAVLQTRVWLEALFCTYKISRKMLEEALAQESEPSGLVLKWLRGKHAVTKAKVERVAKIFPKSDRIYKLPLFFLLNNKPIRRTDLDRAMGQYIKTVDQLVYWDLPKNFLDKPDGEPVIVFQENNLDMLYQRGGVFGFIAILFIMRKAEAAKDSLLHEQSVIYAYKAFPHIARHRHFRKRWQELLELLMACHNRVITTSLSVRPKEAVIRQQIEAPEFISLREQRPRDPRTQRFTDNEDPFELASFSG